MKEIKNRLSAGEMIMFPIVSYAEAFVMKNINGEDKMVSYLTGEHVPYVDDLVENNPEEAEFVSEEEFKEATVYAYSEFFKDDGIPYAGPARIHMAHRGCGLPLVEQSVDGKDEKVKYCPTCDTYVDDDNSVSIDDFKFVYAQYHSSADVADFVYYGDGFFDGGEMMTSYVSVAVALLTSSDGRAYLSAEVYRDSNSVDEKLVTEKIFAMDDEWNDKMQLEYAIDDEYLNIWVMFSEKKTGVQVKAEAEGIVIDFVETIDGQEEVVDEAGYLTREDIGWDFE
jgi:hypothetical protein